MNELAAFLLARYDEDATAAQRIRGRRFYACDDGHVEEPVDQWDDGTDRLPNHHNTWALVLDPDQVLSDLAAKRGIVEDWRDMSPTAEFDGARECLESVCRDLAGVYAGHPEYREEWRP